MRLKKRPGIAGVPLVISGRRLQLLQNVLQVLPGKLEAVLSDNGSEFQGAFDRLLKERGIQHYVTRPKTPKMNAHAERFNRTV